MTTWADQIDIMSPIQYPNIGAYKVLIHIVQFIFTLIVVSLAANIISIERIYYGTSQTAVNFTLAIAVFNLIILIFLVLSPWTGLDMLFPTKLREGFFLKSRPNLVFSFFFTICWFIIMIAISAHADNASNCSIDTNLQKSYPSYESQWLNQCNCAKAAAVFSFFIFFFWVSTTILSAILFWYEKNVDYYYHDSASTVAEQFESKYDNKLSNESYPSLQEDIKEPVIAHTTPSAPTVNEIEYFHHHDSYEPSTRPPSYNFQPIPSAYLPDNTSYPAPYSLPYNNPVNYYQPPPPPLQQYAFYSSQYHNQQ